MTDHFAPLTFNDLVRMASHIRIPAPEVKIDTIKRGQLWVMRWDSTAELGIVTEADDTLPTVVPVTFDGTADADDGDIIESQTFGAARVVRGDTRQVPSVTFEGLYETLESEYTPTLPPILGGREPEHRLDAIAGWYDQIGSGELPGLLKTAIRTPTELAQKLQISGSEALDLLRGRTIPDNSGTDRIAHLLNIPTEQVVQSFPPLPEALRRSLAKRQYRAPIKDLAARFDLDDSQGWQRSAYGVYAMPYRATGSVSDDQWELRIERFFEVQG